MAVLLTDGLDVSFWRIWLLTRRKCKNWHGCQDLHLWHTSQWRDWSIVVIYYVNKASPIVRVDYLFVWIIKNSTGKCKIGDSFRKISTYGTYVIARNQDIDRNPKSENKTTEVRFIWTSSSFITWREGRGHRMRLTPPFDSNPRNTLAFKMCHHSMYCIFYVKNWFILILKKETTVPELREKRGIFVTDNFVDCTSPSRHFCRLVQWSRK